MVSTRSEEIVESQGQPGHETWRAIVFGRDGTNVLVNSTEAGFVFPSIEIPRWERLAEHLTTAVRRESGCDTVCLFTLNDPSQDGSPTGHHYEVMECWRDEHMRRADWKPVHSLTADLFQDEAEFRTLTRCLAELDGYAQDPTSPFAQRGWLTRVRGWVANAIRPLKLELGPSFRQYNSSPSFSLIRLETNGPAVWFKAVGEPNLREFPITLKLAELFPRFMPDILGTKPEWNAWLSREVVGTNLGDTKDIVLWKKAAADLAMLQVGSISRSDLILDSGAHDLRTDVLLTSVDPFLELVARLMDEQAKLPPPTINRQELSLLKLRLEDSLARLEDLRIPTTLGHLDLNPWNIVVSAEGCVFLDWAEAHVGHPFLSFEYLLEHFRRAIGTDVALESRLATAYDAPWRQLFPSEAIAEALASAPLVAVFAYAVGSDVWKDQERLRDSKAAGYFRSLARRMNREATHFIERRSPCLS